RCAPGGRSGRIKVNDGFLSSQIFQRQRCSVSLYQIKVRCFFTDFKAIGHNVTLQVMCERSKRAFPISVVVSGNESVLVISQIPWKTKAIMKQKVPNVSEAKAANSSTPANEAVVTDPDIIASKVADRQRRVAVAIGDLKQELNPKTIADNTKGTFKDLVLDDDGAPKPVVLGAVGALAALVVIAVVVKQRKK